MELRQLEKHLWKISVVIFLMHSRGADQLDQPMYSYVTCGCFIIWHTANSSAQSRTQDGVDGSEFSFSSCDIVIKNYQLQVCTQLPRKHSTLFFLIHSILKIFANTQIAFYNVTNEHIHVCCFSLLLYSIADILCEVLICANNASCCEFADFNSVRLLSISSVIDLHVPQFHDCDY